jgi:hypothetical protein
VEKALIYTDGQTDGGTDGRRDRETDRKKDERTDGQMNMTKLVIKVLSQGPSGY